MLSYLVSKKINKNKLNSDSESLNESDLDSDLSEKIILSKKIQNEFNIKDEEKIINNNYFCHKNEELKEFGIRINNLIYHPECLKCNECNQIINLGLCCLKSENNIICKNCFDNIEKKIKICNICHDILTENDIYEKFLDSILIHNDCIHCYQCNRTKKDLNSFQFYNKYLLCNDCLLILKNFKHQIKTNNFSGKFLKNLNEKFYCNDCNNLILNNFVFNEKKLYCLNCYKKI